MWAKNAAGFDVDRAPQLLIAWFICISSKLLLLLKHFKQDSRKHVSYKTELSQLAVAKTIF